LSQVNLSSLFRPNSVAVIGATEEPGHVGAVVMQNLQAGKFLGPVMPLNPDLEEVFGVDCYKSVDTLPLTPDLAVICTDPESAPGYLKDLGKRGVGAASVLCPGYPRLTRKEKRRIQDKMRDAAEPYGLRILGPSGLGMILPTIGLNCSLVSSDPLPGRIAFISQSASLFTAVIDWAKTKGIGFSYILSLGDRIDLKYGDILDYMSSDPHTRSILLYIESVSNARSFMSAARAAARNKPLLVVKPGRKLWSVYPPVEDQGLDEVYDEAFRRAGMLRVSHIDDLFDAAQTLARSKPLTGDGLAVMTNGGSVGVMAADGLLLGGGRLADFSQETWTALTERLGPNWFRHGIVDMSFDSSGEEYAEALKILLKDKGVNAVLVIHVPFAGSPGEETARAVAEVMSKSSRTVLTCWMGFDPSGEAVKILNDAAIPTYETPDQAVSAFLHMVRYRKNQELLMQMPASLPTEQAPDDAEAKRIIQAAFEEKRFELSEPETKAVLMAYGIPAVPSRMASNVDDAVAAAMELGFPAAVKISSPNIPQPFDVGGIALDLDTPEAVREAAEAVLGRVAAHRPDAVIDGFIVQRMNRRPGAVEMVIQIKVDPVFGPYVVFGRGGIGARGTIDRAYALPPLNMSLARDLIFRTRLSASLDGSDGRPPADIEAICLTLVQASQIMIDIERVVSVEISPLVADSSGASVIGARISLDPARELQRPKLAIRPYPRELEECAVLKSGRHVDLRPIRPEDEPAHFRFFEKLSPEDLRFRFFGVVRELSHEEMAKLTQIDYEREMAFIATAPDEEGIPETLGVVRTSTQPDNSTAEFAIIVRSDMKGMGLGRILMEKMVRYCRDRGTKLLTGQALMENGGMQGLAEKLGFSVARNYDEEVAEMRLPLNA